MTAQYVLTWPVFKLVGAILADLTKAHHTGLILGDRWGSNTLLTAEGVVEVDFDIAL